MSIMDSLKDFINPSMDDEDEYEINEGEMRRMTRYENDEGSAQMLKGYANAKLVLFEPREFEEIYTIGQCLKERKSCVINLHRLRPEVAQRFIDFLSGVCFVINGTIQKISASIILCAPANIVLNTMGQEDEERED